MRWQVHMAETTPNGPDNLVLRYLRRIDARLDEHGHKFDDIIFRLERLEREVAGTRRDIANLHEDWVGMTRRLDNFDQRLQRIERRLDLVEEPATSEP
ncbi:MAG: hypothetical protein JO307_21065 [Bryobacterales bacterium]|nr:hypothetical protein [Bryobacterales bacterium]